MPTYEYLCPEGHTFERFLKMTDRSRAKCPECGQISVKQISGGAGLVFKGSGFYITDYGKDGKGPRKVPSDSAEAKAKAKAEKKETKPAEGPSKSEPGTKGDRPATKKGAE